MSNLKNITSKILSDAEVGKENILAVAKEDENKILTKRAKNAEEAKIEILDKAKTEAKSKKERIVSSAKLQVRNDKLSAKQAIIDEVFVQSVEKLVNLSDEEFITFLKDAIASMNLEGDYNLILNKKGLSLVDNKMIVEINSAIKSKAKITISEYIRDFKGGFILESNGIEINYTFEALVSSQRDELEFEVAKVLFN